MDGLTGKRADSANQEASYRPEALRVIFCLFLLSLILHGPSLIQPSRFMFSPMDIVGRQVELGGSPEFEPANRLLIDPVLQFQPWDLWARRELAAGRFPWWSSLSGGGAPFASNGQSRLFDPFHLAFLLMPLPWAWAAESATRFVLTGLGIFLLCRQLGFGQISRVFCPLAINLTGFFTLWRLYPLVATASVLPWLFLCVVNLSKIRTRRNWLCLTVMVAWLMVSGNVQVAAAGLLVLCIMVAMSQKTAGSTGYLWYIMPLSAVFMGLCITSPAWISLLDYLAESPILSDRVAEHSAGGRGSTARWADLPCLVSPFIYGSERQGDTNIHKSIGAGNVNEAATGFIGLCSLLFVWLAVAGPGHANPARRYRVRWLFSLFAVSLLVGYRLPPVVWVWPKIPILNAIDPRRFLVGMPLAGVLLAGLGLDRIAANEVPAIFQKWLVRIVLIIGTAHVPATISPFLFKDTILAKATAHYEKSVAPGPAHQQIVAQRVSSQFHGLTHAWPAYLLGRTLLCLCFIAVWCRYNFQPHRRASLLALLAIAELLHFGWNYNPNVDKKWMDALINAPVGEKLKTMALRLESEGFESRFLALAEALPPNQLVAMGLKDLRNYDSIELLAGLKPFEPLIGERRKGDRTSRLDLGWKDVGIISEALKAAGVVGVLGHSRPPEGLFSKTSEIVPGLWLGQWPGVLRFEGDVEKIICDEPGRLEIRSRLMSLPGSILVRETFARGWSAKTGSGQPLSLLKDEKTGLIRIEIPAQVSGQTIEARFRPTHLKVAIYAQITGLFFCLSVLLSGQLFTKKLSQGLLNDRRAKLRSMNRDDHQ